MVFGALIGFEIPPLLMVAVALLVILLVNSWMRTPANLPPCPVRPLPFLGHLAHMGTDPRGVIMDWRKKKGEIFSLYFGSTLVVVLSGYDILKDALVKQADFFSDKPKDGTLPALKFHDGIVTSSGAVWKENRSVVLSILRSFGMGKNTMAEKVTDEVDAYVAEIVKFKDQPTDVKEITTRAVSNIICNMLIGKRYEYTDKEFQTILELFDYTVKVLGASSLQIWFPWIRYLPGDLVKIKESERMSGVFTKIAKDFIKRAEDEDAKDINSENIIASYLKEMRAKKEIDQATLLSYNGVERVVSDLMIAGTETTATTLLWFYLYMIHNPEAQRKVHEEIDKKIGHSRVPNIADKASLTYVNAAILETQRLSSILPLGLFHRCSEETTLRGYTIPKDAYVMPHLDAALLGEKIWGDPETFRPERFIDGQGNLLNPEQFVPFSLGRRVCLGEALAKTELFLFITHVLQRYTIEPEVPGSPPPLNSTLGLTRAPNPYKLKFIERDV